MRFVQVPKYKEYNKNYTGPLGVNFNVKSKSVKKPKSAQKLRQPGISKPSRSNGQDYIVRNYDKPLIRSNNRKNKENKLFRRFRQYGKTKKDENLVLSPKERRKEEKQEAKFKKLVEKQQKLFRKSLLIEIDRYDRIKRKKELELSNKTAKPLFVKVSGPLKHIKSRKTKSATTQYEPKIKKIWSNRRKVLAIDSESKWGLLSKNKLKKEKEKKRRTPISKRFVNCCYRTCCQIYCCVTFVLIVGIWVILFMPL